MRKQFVDRGGGLVVTTFAFNYSYLCSHFLLSMLNFSDVIKQVRVVSIHFKPQKLIQLDLDGIIANQDQSNAEILSKSLCYAKSATFWCS